MLVDYLVQPEGLSPLATRMTCAIAGVADHSQVAGHPVGVEDSGMTSYLGAMWVESQSLETETQLLHKGGAIYQLHRPWPGTSEYKFRIS